MLTELGLHSALAPGRKDVDYLMINCEGCEFSLIRAIAEHAPSKIVQVQFHQKGGIIKGRTGDADESLCDIEARMSKHYTLVWKYPYNWQLWMRNY